MNWSNVRLIFQREVRDQMRDRRMLFMIFVLPMLLYPLLGMSSLQVTQFLREHPSKILLVGRDQLPEEPPLLDGDRFAGDSPEAKLLELSFAEWDGDVEAQARAGIDSGEWEAVVYFPPDFGARLAEFRRELAERAADPSSWKTPPNPEVYHDTSKEKSKIAHDRAMNLLHDWAGRIGEQNLKERKLPVSAVRPVTFASTDVAAPDHRDSSLWAKLLPFILLIWALTGAFYPAIDLCAGEKERGTLETLLCSPAQRSEIVVGKLLTIMVFSCATALLNLASMGLTGGLIIGQMQGLGGPLSTLSAPPLTAALWLVPALLPISALFSALCLALASFARSSKEGQYYLMPLLLVILPLMMLPMAPGVEISLGNSLIPITGMMLVLREAIQGNFSEAVRYLVPVLAVTLACCVLAVRWAIDQFSKESVLFRESERLDMGLWLRHLVRDRGDTPTAVEALFCAILILILRFFASFSFPAPRDFASFASSTFAIQVAFILMPALMMTVMLTRSPRQTLLLNRPKWLALPAAVVMAIALHPAIVELSRFIQEVYPPNPGLVEQLKTYEAFISDAPNIWVLLGLMAVLPAICEELTFRGFILSGFRHMGHKWRAIVLSSAFFGVTHALIQQSLSAILVGIVIGYLAVQTGSILPGILFHITNNALLTTQQYWAGEPSLQHLLRSTDAETFGYHGWVIALGAGMTIVVLLWLRSLPYQRTEEEALQEAIEKSVHAAA